MLCASFSIVCRTFSRYADMNILMSHTEKRNPDISNKTIIILCLLGLSKRCFRLFWKTQNLPFPGFCNWALHFLPWGKRSWSIEKKLLKIMKAAKNGKCCYKVTEHLVDSPSVCWVYASLNIVLNINLVLNSKRRNWDPNSSNLTNITLDKP